MARNCFHWPLELAEVFAEGRHGFDAVVGNPPFMSGNRISQEIGHDINAHVAKLFPPFSKRVDISARFLARSAALIHPSGYLGQLATNTISQGTTRKGGLDILTGDGLQIVRARKDFDWPGVASVIASAIWLTAGQWRGERLLDGSPVPTINSLLESSRPGLSKPRGLAARRMDCFQGSGPWGDGFSLSAQVADEMLRADSRNGDVVRTAVGGKELNAQLRPEPDRWVINMEERSLDAASAYLEPFAHLSATVRPWREVLDPKRYPRIVGEWWKYFHPRQELYDEIEARQLDRLMARCRVSDHHMVAWIPADCVYLDSLSVWCFDDWSWFGVIQSGVHEAWARQYASTLKRDMRYGATNCFRTFPAPESSETVGRIAERYEAARFALGSARGVGLTGVFNLVHDMSEAGAESIELRRLQAELDYAVRDAYGWDDLELGHDFHETRQGMRHTIEPVGRIEVLDRLLELNHARYDEEVKAGFQGQKAKPVGGRVPRHASTAQETLL